MSAGRVAHRPSLLDYVALHARRRPLHPAVLRNGEAIGYAALYRDLKSVIGTLAGLGLPRGASVAIGHGDLYVQLLLTFGFECLGIATGAFRPVEGAGCHALLRAADLVMAPPAMALPECRRVIHLSPAWIEGALAGPPSAPVLPEAGWDEPAIILRSSGTTGQPKRMAASRRILERRRALDRLTLAPSAHVRLLTVMHFSVGFLQRSAGSCLRLGGTFMFDTQRTAAEVLRLYRPTHLILLPFQLGTLLARLPEAARPLLPGLVVQTMGASLPAAMRQEALRKLCGGIVSGYATNETGPIGTVDEAGDVTLLDGVTAEIVGPDDGRLPPGEAGLLRIRCEGMVSGYLDDAAATAASFRGGWFYPGDIAALLGQGRLRLLGRRDDVLNLGGLKVSAADVEDRIRAVAPRWDAAVVPRDDGAGGHAITVCVAAGAAFDARAYARAIGPVLDYPFAVRVVPAIPRTAEGKVRRALLLQVPPAPPAGAEAPRATRLQPA